MVVVIGTYIDSDGDGVPDIGAIVVEKGPAEQVTGIVTEVPDADGLFLVIDRDGNATTVELQTSYTKIFGPGGEALTADALQVGQGIEVEGVSVGDPAVLRAALILLDSGDDPDQLSGTVAEPIIDPEFVLSTATGDVDVCVNTGATITVNWRRHQHRRKRCRHPGRQDRLRLRRTRHDGRLLRRDGCGRRNRLTANVWALERRPAGARYAGRLFCCRLCWHSSRMPELPEVETSRRGIEPHLVGQQIVDVTIRDRRLRWPVSEDLDNRLPGQTIISVGRRAKYLLINTTGGTAILHLGMSGHVSIVPRDAPAGIHDHVDIGLASGHALRLRDPRRFGSLHWSDDPAAHWLLRDLGPEPLGDEFSGEYLWRDRGAGGWPSSSSS